MLTKNLNFKKIKKIKIDYCNRNIIRIKKNDKKS